MIDAIYILIGWSVNYPIINDIIDLDEEEDNLLQNNVFLYYLRENLRNRFHRIINFNLPDEVPDEDINNPIQERKNNENNRNGNRNINNFAYYPYLRPHMDEYKIQLQRPDELHTRTIKKCAICFEFKQYVILNPCTHSDFCFECINKLWRSISIGEQIKCPLCRTIIEDVL